ncbi:MAG: pirin family protein [Bacteroidetes bacterium]|nr:pirin family protein [Bacteroidota bacterium]
MKTKSVERIITPPSPHFVGDGFRVHNFIPSDYHLSMTRMDPFIMLDYNSKFNFPPTDKPRGVDVHPHRGFETVTIAYKGKVAHHDSYGNSGVIGEGDVQWMTAASGVLHKEYHESGFSKQGGDFHMVQLWVNLPAKNKMSQPKYQSITKDQIAVYNLPDNGGTVEVIAGNYKDKTGPASTFSPVNLMNLKIKRGARTDFNFPANFNTGLIVIEGKIRINDNETADTDRFILLANDGEIFSVEAEEDSVVLIMSGEPLNEPIAARGPFVMNTKEELIQAYEDFTAGKFGRL